MIYAGILAAGLGERMHRQDMPKQFLLLGEKPIIIHTLEQFMVNGEVGRVVVVAPESWLLYTKDLIEEYGMDMKECAVIPGGLNKTESIGLALRYIDETWGVKEDDALIAHDAIRPFVTQRIIDMHIESLKEYKAVNTAMVMNDSILISNDDGMLGSVPDHGNMFAEQTPQSYSLLKLKEILMNAVAAGISLRSEYELPRLWLRMGASMSLVCGDYFNMKIINPYDLEVANALLKERSE